MGPEFHINILDDDERASLGGLRDRTVAWLDGHGDVMSTRLRADVLEAPRFNLDWDAAWSFEPDGSPAADAERAWANCEREAEIFALRCGALFDASTEKAFVYVWPSAIGLILVGRG